MNLSVRRTKTRRGPGGTGLVFGLPMRVKMPLPAVNEPGDELDGITELESAVDESRQSCEPEVTPRSQGNHLTGGSVRTASSSSDAERGTDQGPPTHESHKETSTVDESLQSCEPEVAPRSQGNHLAGSSVHTASSSSEADRDPLTDQRPPTREYHKETFSYKLEKSTDNHTAESQSVFTSQATDSQVCNQPQNSTLQEGSQSFTTNPHSTTLLLNNSRQQADAANSSRQQTLHQIPTPQGFTSSSNSISGSSTLQRQTSSSITPVVSRNDSFSQQNIPQVNQGSQLQAIPGQFHAAGYGPGYPPDHMQLVRPVVVAAQAPQNTIVVKSKSYQKLGTIGKGGSSKVSSPNNVLL